MKVGYIQKYIFPVDKICCMSAYNEGISLTVEKINIVK